MHNDAVNYLGRYLYLLSYPYPYPYVNLCMVYIYMRSDFRFRIPMINLFNQSIFMHLFSLCVLPFTGDAAFCRLNQHAYNYNMYLCARYVPLTESE
jgi:hypothetical protein